MKKILLLAMALPALAACGAFLKTEEAEYHDYVQRRIDESVFFQNQKTGICFARVPMGYGDLTIMSVECTEGVLREIKENSHG